MKITAIVLALLTGTAALATEIAAAPAERRVTVCTEGNTDLASMTARAFATRIFAGIGVAVHWHLGLLHCPPQAFTISFDYTVPENFKPGALACAGPGQNSDIRVFVNRIARNYTQTLTPSVLAYVLVHEIAHVLQGIDRHSAHGIMKARWDRHDCTQMAWLLLEFEKQDIDLIYNGLATRARHAPVSGNTTLEAAAVP